MFRKLGLAVALSLIASSAFAACTNPLQIKDGGAATISMSMTSNADGFCQYNFNMAQINGVVPLMGNGATGTGSPRMTIANDNTIPTGWPTAANQTAASAARGEGATGAAVPSGAQYVGLNSGGNLLGWAAKAGNTYASTDVVPGVAVVNTNNNGQAAATSSSPVVVAKNSGTGSTVAGAAVGTAGTASTEVVTVQGIASMTPFLSNPGTAANWGIGATGAAVPANASYFGFNSGGNLTGASSSAPLPVRPGDGTRQAVLDPCEANTQLYLPISITSATTTRIVTPSASNKTYICGLIIITGAANNVGIVEGTGGTCGTGTAGVIGGTTAANGPNFAANGGLALQAGKTAHAYTAGTNVDLCAITSSAGPYAGGIKYVQAP